MSLCVCCMDLADYTIEERFWGMRVRTVGVHVGKKRKHKKFRYIGKTCDRCNRRY